MQTAHRILAILAAGVLAAGSVRPTHAQVVADAPGRIANFSVRANSGAGDNVLVSGFVLGGQNTRPLLLRAIGPGLSDFGVTDFMIDPELKVFRTPEVEMTNDSWSDGDDLTPLLDRLGAFDLQHGSRDAAVLLPLSPGAYTAHAQGKAGSTGQVLLELYDAADPGDLTQSIANISLRGELRPDNPLMIAGFVLTAGRPKHVLIRAVGPTLAEFGVANALGNPRIRLYHNGDLVAENDDWAPAGTDPSATEAAFDEAGAFPLPRGSLDAVLDLELPPGAYSAHIDDPTGTHGVVLIEIYDLDPPGNGGIAPNPDPAPGAAPDVWLHARNSRIQEGVTPAGSVLIVRSGDVSQPLRVRLATSGTADADDIPGIPATVLIPAGSSTAAVPVSAWNDRLVEPAETLTVSLVEDDTYTIRGLGRVHFIIEDETEPASRGWRAEFYNNTDLEGEPVVVRHDEAIEFEWEYEPPAEGVPADRFSARWTGYLETPATGDYTFTTYTDDGVRLWIDDELVIDHWTNQSAKSHSAVRRLAGGVRYAVRMEFYDRGGRATAALYWTPPGSNRSALSAREIFQIETPAPTITSARTALALAGAPFHYQLTATGNPQSFAVTDLPAGLTFDPITGAITGTPANAGAYSIVLEATNPHGTGMEVLQLNVLAAGAAPVAERWETASDTLEAPDAVAASTAVLDQLQSDAPAGTALERIRGFITPPESGDYRFWVAASGPATLRIADSDQPADRWERARVSTPGGSLYWFASEEQASLPIRLEAGKRYYFEVLHRPAPAGGPVSVAWRLPSASPDAPPAIIPGWALARYDAVAPETDGQSLYLARLRPADGAATTASGTASLLFNAETRTATITLRMTGLSSPQVAAYLLVGEAGFTGPLIQPLPNGQFNNFTWRIEDAGTLTADDLVAALQTGLLNVIIYSADFPEGELRGHFAPALGSSAFHAPPAPPAVDLDTPPTAPEAVRFLTQATFGPDTAAVDHLRQIGYRAWLDEQIAAAPTWHLPALDAILESYRQEDPEARVSYRDRVHLWWQTAVQAPDQLRQRMAFALSEILVVSDRGLPGADPAAASAYYDLLVKNAFGNFRDLLLDVTLSPAMGYYLSMLRNEKGDPVRGTLPDENYAREIMQLFTIGLNKLHPDGTLMLDAYGAPIPTYTQETIMGLARVFTGWSYQHTGDGEPNFRWGPKNFRDPMMHYPEYHETGDKLLLESMVLPGGMSGRAELEFVVDMLFNHPNVGPFISRRLIQRFVTSNPSPGYVYRVARVFADNGDGVRGDLGAVIRAILLDPEARSTALAATLGFGKLREPLLRMTHLWRTFHALPLEEHPFSYYNPEREMLQSPLRAPTVFNFFEPGYAQPGILAAAGLVAPEFQITNEQSLVATTNILRRAAFRGVGSWEYPIVLDLSEVLPLAADDDQLLDWMDLMLLGGTMSAEMRDTLRSTLNLLEIGRADEEETVKSIIYLIATSSEFAVQK